VKKLVLLVLVAVIIAGCANEKPVKVPSTHPVQQPTVLSSTEPTPTTSPIAPAPSPMPSPTPTAQVHYLTLKVGESARTSREEVTVEKVFLTTMYGGKYGNYWPDYGNVYVFAKVRIKDVSDSLKDYVAVSEFSATDESGRKYDVLFMDVPGYLEATSLNPGEYVEGLIAFEVPEKTKLIKIKYDFGGLIEANPAAWVVNIEKVPLEKPKLSIVSGHITGKSTVLGYEVEGVTFTVENFGRIPVYLETAKVKYGSGSWEYLTSPDVLLSPGEKRTVTSSEYALLNSYPSVVYVGIFDGDRILTENTI